MTRRGLTFLCVAAGAQVYSFPVDLELPNGTLRLRTNYMDDYMNPTGYASQSRLGRTLDHQRVTGFTFLQELMETWVYLEGDNGQGEFSWGSYEGSLSRKLLDKRSFSGAVLEGVCKKDLLDKGTFHARVISCVFQWVVSSCFGATTIIQIS